MSSHLAFGLLLTAALAATLPVQSPPPEDPCLQARHIAQLPPCLAGSPCRSEELWRGIYGAPRPLPAGLAALPPELAARLPEDEVTLGSLNGVADTFQRLGQASKLEVLLDPAAQGELSGKLDAMSLQKAWRFLLSIGGFSARLDGDKVFLSKAEPQLRQESRGRRINPSIHCPAR